MTNLNNRASGSPVPPAAFAAPAAAGHDPGPLDLREVAVLVAAAMAGLRRDLEAYHPNAPAIDFAMVGETHAAIRRRWHPYSPAAQTILLTALQEDATGMLHRLRARSAQLLLDGSHAGWLHDETVKFDALSAVMLEETYRIAADLRTLCTTHTLQ